MKRVPSPTQDVSWVSQERADSFFTHHGILGMRWGIRRTQAQLARNGGRLKKGSSKKEDHEDYKKAHVSKRVKSMSDVELRDRINRLQMEKQYTQLTHKEKSAGAKFVTNILIGAAQQTASKYVSQYMSQGVDALIKTVMKK